MDYEFGLMRRKCYNECIVKGKKTHYHGCSTKTLEEAKKFYCDNLGWKHIGSGFITYHDGVRNKWDDKHHFFIRN